MKQSRTQNKGSGRSQRKRRSRQERFHIVLRILLIMIGMAGNVLLLTPFVLRGILNIGNVTGAVLMTALMLYGAFSPKMNAGIRNIKKKKAGRIVLSGVTTVLVIIFLLAMTETGFMLAAASKTPAENATVVVLGCRAYGTRPSIMLASRLDAAYEYLVLHPESMCIVSGGQGEDESVSEAECMYLYLVEKGIAPERIFQEAESTSTRENLEFSKALIEAEGLNNEIAIVTNEYHQYRASMIADTLYPEYGAISAQTPLWLYPTYYVRELYGILYEWVF